MQSTHSNTEQLQHMHWQACQNTDIDILENESCVCVLVCVLVCACVCWGGICIHMPPSQPGLKAQHRSHMRILLFYHVEMGKKSERKKERKGYLHEVALLARVRGKCEVWFSLLILCLWILGP